MSRSSCSRWPTAEACSGRPSAPRLLQRLDLGRQAGHLIVSRSARVAVLQSISSPAENHPRPYHWMTTRSHPSQGEAGSDASLGDYTRTGSIGRPTPVPMLHTYQAAEWRCRRPAPHPAPSPSASWHGASLRRPSSSRCPVPGRRVAARGDFLEFLQGHARITTFPSGTGQPGTGSGVIGASIQKHLTPGL